LQLERERNGSKKGKESTKNPWEKVLTNVDAKEGGYKGIKDVSRMKAVMTGRKEDVQKGLAKID